MSTVVIIQARMTLFYASILNSRGKIDTYGRKLKAVFIRRSNLECGCKRVSDVLDSKVYLHGFEALY